MKNVSTVIAGLLIAASIAATGFYFVFTYQNLKTTEITNQARFECAQSSRFTTTDAKNNQVWYPVSDLYQKCLNEKNIK